MARIFKVISYFRFNREKIAEAKFKNGKSGIVSVEYGSVSWSLVNVNESAICEFPPSHRHPAVWPAGWHLCLHPVRSLRNAAGDRCTCVYWPRSLNIVALGWLLEKLSAFKSQENTAASPTENHPQPLLPLKWTLGFRTIYWRYKCCSASEVRRRLSNNQQGEKQQIAGLRKLAIATTSKRNLSKTQTKEFTCRNQANEGSPACC